MGKLNKSQCYRLSLKGLTNTEIAKKFNVSEPAVSKAITSLRSQDGYQLGVETVVTFLDWFERAAEYFNMQNGEYEQLIDQVDKIKIDSKIKPEEKVKLLLAKIETIRRIKGSQDSNMERIVYQAKEGQLISAITLMRDILRPKAKIPDNAKILKVTEEKKDGKKTKQ